MQPDREMLIVRARRIRPRLVLGLALLLAVAACASSPEPVGEVVQDEPTSTTTTTAATEPPASGETEPDPSESLPDSPDVDSEPSASLGRWKVTKLTGAIQLVGTGPAPPQGICAPGTWTFTPVLDSSDTWVGLSDTGADVSGVEMLQLIFAESDAPDFDIDVFPNPEQLEPVMVGVAYDGEPDAVFLFSFAFDNGYHSNSVLEGLDTFYLEIEQRATVTTYGGGLFGEEGLVRGWSSSTISGTAQGKGFFLVGGRLVGPDRLEGTWQYTISSSLADCEESGTGSGTWAAEFG